MSVAAVKADTAVSNGEGFMHASVSGTVPSVHKVLLARDCSADSEAIFHAARDVCGAFDANLLILHVFEYVAADPSETEGELLELGSIYQRAGSALGGLVQGLIRGVWFARQDGQRHPFSNDSGDDYF